MRTGVDSGRITALAAIALLAMLAACSAPASPNTETQSPAVSPSRIVSMNPCIDAVLYEIADSRQIAAISHYSQDIRATSVPLEWAVRFAAVGDEAEDVVAMAPDLVLAGPHVAPQTMTALERLGIRLVRFGVPDTVDESKAQIIEIARTIGQENRGTALNARIDASLARAAAASERPPSALIWQDGGLVPGKGTLADELLVRTGFRSASAELGLAQWDRLSLEALLWASPDILLTGRAGMESGGESDATHPVLRKSGRSMMVADFPSSLLHCGGPVIIRAAAHLDGIRRRWQQRGAS